MVRIKRIYAVAKFIIGENLLDQRHQRAIFNKSPRTLRLNKIF